MADPLTTIMQALVTVVSGISPPAGQTALKITAEPPDTIDLFPWALAMESSIEVPGPGDGSYGVSFGYAAIFPQYHIDLHLLFAPQDQKYSVRLKREWTSVVLKALLQQNDTLAGADIELSVGEVNFRPVEYNGMSYLATTYTLRIIAGA